MQWKNSATRYGAVTKTLHWLIAIFFINQYVVATIMTRVPLDGRKETSSTGTNPSV